MEKNIADRLAQAYGLDLTPEEAGALGATMMRREIPKGGTVSELNRRNRHMFFIGQGILRQFYFKEGRNITEHFGTPGDVLFCIESLFLGLPSQQGIEAVEAATVWSIDYAELKRLTRKYPGVNRLFQAIMEKALVVSQLKADSWRFESSQERYTRFCREYPEVARRAPMAHIASYLLMTPETLCRVRAALL